MLAHKSHQREETLLELAHQGALVHVVVKTVWFGNFIMSKNVLNSAFVASCRSEITST